MGVGSFGVLFRFVDGIWIRSGRDYSGFKPTLAYFKHGCAPNIVDPNFYFIVFVLLLLLFWGGRRAIARNVFLFNRKAADPRKGQEAWGHPLASHLLALPGRDSAAARLDHVFLAENGR